LTCCKASLLFLSLAIFAASDVDWSGEIVHASNAVGIFEVVLRRANLSYEKVDPVSRAVVNTKPAYISLLMLLQFKTLPVVAHIDDQVVVGLPVSGKKRSRF
jgi:hypothetical protein